MFSNGITTTLLATLLAGGQLAAAHMEMSFPAPFRSKFNPNSDPGSIDYSMTAPLEASGANYPCKGYLSDLGTPAGKPTASFAPGGTYNFTITGGANHRGGSCQASLSYDGGKTFRVIKSIVGGCPLQPNYDFTIPNDAQAGEAVFAWTWHNEVGNREMYMNCAAVTIGGSAGAAKREVNSRAASAAFASRPQIYVANIGNGCVTKEGFDVDYPNPGPDVTNNGGNLLKPDCGDSGPGSGSGGSNPPPASSPAQQPPVAPTSAPVQPPPIVPTSAPVQAPVPTTAPSGPVAGKPTTVPGGVFITVPADDEPVATSSPVVSQPAAEPTVVAPSTTLQTLTKSATAEVPAGTGGAGNGTGSGSGDAAGGYAPGTACTAEGAWNCVGGSSFQRCASGSWSVVMAMAAGTECAPGESEVLTMRDSPKKARAVLRHERHARKHAARGHSYRHHA